MDMFNEKLKRNKRILSPQEIRSLNVKYKPLTARQRIQMLYDDFDVEEVMLTSSFAGTSALLLKLFADVNKDQKIFSDVSGAHLQRLSLLQHLF